MTSTRAVPANPAPRRSIQPNTTRSSRSLMNWRSSAAVVALALSVSLSAQSSRSLDQLQHDIDAILGSPVLQHGFWGVVIKPVDGSDAWYARNAEKLMMPASSLKVVTLAAAADKLGWDFRYDTK